MCTGHTNHVQSFFPRIFFLNEEYRITSLKEVMLIFVMFLKVIGFLRLMGADRLISDTTTK